MSEEREKTWKLPPSSIFVCNLTALSSRLLFFSPVSLGLCFCVLSSCVVIVVVGGGSGSDSGFVVDGGDDVLVVIAGDGVVVIILIAEVMYRWLHKAATGARNRDSHLINASW